MSSGGPCASQTRHPKWLSAYITWRGAYPFRDQWFDCPFCMRLHVPSLSVCNVFFNHDVTFGPVEETHYLPLSFSCTFGLILDTRLDGLQARGDLHLEPTWHKPLPLISDGRGGACRLARDSGEQLSAAGGSTRVLCSVGAPAVLPLRCCIHHHQACKQKCTPSHADHIPRALLNFLTV